MADSTASEPLETKNERWMASGVSSASLAASSIERGCAYVQLV